MNAECVVPRSEKVAIALSKLTSKEKRQLEKATDGYYQGGEMLQEPLRSRAVTLELAYRSSGRLRADVYKVLRGDDVFFVNE